MSTESTVPEPFVYDGIKEAVYTASHPEVVSWTGYFLDRTHAKRIFDRMNGELVSPSIEKAKAVGVCWHVFSESTPWLLCQAAAQVSTNEKRHYVIQTAFEELGMRDVTEIHPDLFWSAAKMIGVTEADHSRIGIDKNLHESLQALKSALLGYRTDAEVLGVLLGLEIPARENIEAIFQGLAHSSLASDALAKTKFFIVHRFVESEHIRITVANFLRFCQSPEEKRLFIKGFEDGIEFWSTFWNAVSDLVEKERSGAIAS